MQYNRDEYRYNFLKNIIVRMDFQGVFEPELDVVLPLVKPYLKEKGFSRYLKKKNNQVEINVSAIDKAPEASGKIQSQVIHSFVNDDRGFVLDISESFICLIINATVYTPFEDYSSFVLDVAKLYKDNIDFFSITRIGVRKTNICMLKDKNKINDYFSSKYFQYFSEIQNVNTLQSNRRDAFQIDQYKGNLLCSIEEGMSGEVVLYRIALDIDLYLDDISSIEDNMDLNVMNDIIFKIYSKALTERFKKALVGEDEEFLAEIVGVEQNE